MLLYEVSLFGRKTTSLMQKPANALSAQSVTVPSALRQDENIGHYTPAHEAVKQLVLPSEGQGFRL